MKVSSTAWDRKKKDLSPYDFISYTGRFSLIESGVNKAGSGPRSESIFFLKNAVLALGLGLGLKL